MFENRKDGKKEIGLILKNWFWFYFVDLDGQKNGLNFVWKWICGYDEKGKELERKRWFEVIRFGERAKSQNVRKMGLWVRKWGQKSISGRFFSANWTFFSRFLNFFPFPFCFPFKRGRFLKKSTLGQKSPPWEKMGVRLEGWEGA